MEQKRKDAEFTNSLKAVDADWISKTTNQQFKEDSYKKYMRRNMVEATQGYNQKLYLDKIEEMRAKAMVDRRKFQEMAVKEASLEDQRIRKEKLVEIEKKMKFKGELDKLN